MGAKVSAHCGANSREARNLNAYAYKAATDAIAAAVLADDADDGGASDMGQPLSSYFISSSHNTYLNGDQLTSLSTPSAVARALRLGCRVVELDVWERKRIGGRDSIIVTHGGTLCSKARFRLMIRAVREHAFVHSEYPVIVTLENHVTKYESQKKMARILKEELGEMLFVWKAGDVVAPNRLLKKVVIRDKPKKPKEDPEEADLAAATESAATPADVLAVLDADPEPGEDDVEAEGEVEHKLLEHQTSSELSELIYIRNTKTKTLPSVTSEALTGHEQFVPSSSWYV